MNVIKNITQINSSEIVIYGAGRYGKTIYGFLEKSKVNVIGFIQSEKGNTVWNGVRIFVAEDFFSVLCLEKKNSIGVCLALKDELAKAEILSYLNKIGVADNNIYDCTELIEQIIYSVNLGMNNAEGKTENRLCADGKFTLSKFIENINEYSIQVKDYTHEKVKVCIILASGTYLFWNSIETICQAFIEDSRYEVIILLADEFCDPIFDNVKNLVVKERTYRCVIEGAYNIEEEQPDILLVTFDNGLCKFPNCQTHIHYFKLVVAIVGELITYRPDSEYWEGVAGYQYYHPDYYVIDSLLYDYMNGKGLLRSNMIEMGSAKFDHVYKSMNKEIRLSGEWNKLKGKKVVLWGNTHGVHNGIVSYTCTFDLYAKAIFGYARKHSDVAFIVRLHPTFLWEMKKHRYWSEEDFRRIKLYCHESDNLIWDDSSSYDNAYSVADGILTDGFCGMILSSLPLMKPICACYRYDTEAKPLGHANLVENLYQAHSIKELINYLDMIRVGDDPMYEQRRKIKEKYIHNFDGKMEREYKSL